MKQSKDETPEEIASIWAVRRMAGLSQQEETELQAWLANPLNYALFAEAEYALSLLEHKEREPDQSAMKEVFERAEKTVRGRKKKRWMVRIAGWGFAAAAGLALGYLSLDPDNATADPSGAIVVQPLLKRLADGSRVELNAKADLQVEFSDETRVVRLLRGEAHFIVAKDVIRPFIVFVGPVKVQAVGTAFNVRFGADAVEVLVTEGQVRVSDYADGGSSKKDADLAAGHQAVIPLIVAAADPVVAAVSDDEIRREMSWRKMRFELTSATLGAAVELFNRKGRAQLVIGDDALKERRISGIFWADDPEKFAALLTSTMDIVAERREDGKIVLKQQ